jgi:hypothetical protein
MKPRVALALSAAAAFVSSAALAADVGARLSDKGNVVIGAERMFGITVSSLESKSSVGGDTVTSTQSHTSVGLLWSYPFTIHSVPRVGLDYLVAPNLSLGLGGGFFRVGSVRKTEAGGTAVEKDGPTSTAWIVAPRVGYVLDLGGATALWLRGGLSFYGSTNEADESSGSNRRTSKLTMSGSALALEPSFVWTPAPHFGLYGGLALDAPLGGKNRSETTTTTGVGSVSNTTTSESDYAQSSYGVTFGVLGYL